LIHAGTCTPSVSEGESIQAAIDRASAGDTICVGVGTYRETITLKNGITLQGEELARTIIDGEGSGTVISGANSITIRNITIAHGEIGLSTTNRSGITVTNVIVVDNTTTGVECKGSTLILENGVIDANGTGIVCDNATHLTMRNTIISNNSVDIGSGTEPSPPPPPAPPATAVSSYYSNSVYNNSRGHYLVAAATNGVEEDPLSIDEISTEWRYNLIYDHDTTNYPTDDATSVIGQDPLFVNRSSNDYHVKMLSPAIDAGDPDAGYNDPDGTIADIGAYGGPAVDSAPYPVTNLTASEVSDDSLKLSWSANNAYNISGYNVYFDNDTSGDPYDGTSNEGTSPIYVVGDVTTYTLTNLPIIVNLAVPTRLSTTPGDGTLHCSWNAVDRADGYILSYGTAPGHYSSEIDVGNRTSYAIENLTNNVTYYIVVKAYAYPTYYLAVSAYDDQNNGESVLANEITKVLSTRSDSDTSGEVSDYPERTVPFRDLDDEYNCFIASAVYGSSFSSEVVLLRKFRDHFLRTNYLGGKMVSLYYRLSPPIAQYIRRNAGLKPVVKVILLPVIGMARFCIEWSPCKQMVIVALLTFSCVMGVLFIRRKDSG
jgi:hypothetical protein